MASDPERHESERRKSLEPYEPKAPVIRASDTDRDRAVDQLRQHLADGRLTMEEFTERVDEAYEARTTADLQQALRELPHVRVTEPRSPEQREKATRRKRKRERELRGHLVTFVLVNMFLVAIWLATSVAAGEPIFFWPIFPILGWGLGLAVQTWQVYGERED
jgi:cation transport ATPase